jgi:hypothetical protein
MGLFQQDLNSILVGFQRTIAKLDRLAARNAEIIKFNDDAVRNIREESGRLEDERHKATVVREKLMALVG